MSILSELKRRNVFRMTVLYIAAAWLIMQVTEVLVTLAHLPHWIGPTIIWLLAIGFPISLIFSWFYEITPQGISLERNVDPEQSITNVTGRRLDFLVISLLCAAVILFAYDKWWISGPPEKSIAVLPFTNMSDDPKQEYFSDGISEELLNLLAKIPEMTVISRSSAFSLKGKSLSIPETARLLNVAHVLEGSVRKAGSQVRITAQLIDASTDKHLWSETYDRELKDIFAIQDEIAAAIVTALKEHLGLQIEAAPRVITAANTEAHDAYLRGRYLVVHRTRATNEGAVREFEKAIALDPEYALAHAELAMANLLLIFYGSLTESEGIARAAPHAELAMALDPTLAEAHAASGYVLWIQGNADKALTHYEQAIQTNPNYSDVSIWMGIALSRLGRYDEGFAVREKAAKLNPLSIPSVSQYVHLLINRNRLAEAERELEKLAFISPVAYAICRGELAAVGGKWANAALGYLDALQIDPENNVTRNELSEQFAKIGLEKEALNISEYTSPRVLTMLGRPGDAVTTAQARVSENPISLGRRHSLGLALAGAGDYGRARPILEELWQSSGGRVTASGLFRAAGAAALIAIRRDTDEEADVSELVAAIRDNVRRYHETGITALVGGNRSVNYDEGIAAYLTGEREEGLALIAKGAEDGMFILQSEAYLPVLYDDPGFAPIRAMQEERQIHERQKFLNVVCNDNPYVDVWQPAEWTCEWFGAAGEN